MHKRYFIDYQYNYIYLHVFIYRVDLLLTFDSIFPWQHRRTKRARIKKGVPSKKMHLPLKKSHVVLFPIYLGVVLHRHDTVIHPLNLKSYGKDSLHPKTKEEPSD